MSSEANKQSEPHPPWACHLVLNPGKLTKSTEMVHGNDSSEWVTTHGQGKVDVVASQSLPNPREMKPRYIIATHMTQYCRQWHLKQSATKQYSAYSIYVSHSASCKLSIGVSSMFTQFIKENVLVWHQIARCPTRTPVKVYPSTEEQKQVVDKASWLQLGCQVSKLYENLCLHCAPVWTRLADS